MPSHFDPDRYDGGGGGSLLGGGRALPAGAGGAVDELKPVVSTGSRAGAAEAGVLGVLLELLVVTGGGGIMKEGRSPERGGKFDIERLPSDGAGSGVPAEPGPSGRRVVCVVAPGMGGGSGMPPVPPVGVMPPGPVTLAGLEEKPLTPASAGLG
jgi:hypothetical protein